MKRALVVLALIAAFGWTPDAVSSQNIADAYRDVADRLIDAATENHDAFARLTDLVDRFGHRVSGSVALEQAIDWIMVQMEADGLDKVTGDPVMVPHWVRGEESIEMTLPRALDLPMLGLGGSIATPPRGDQGGGARGEQLRRARATRRRSARQDRALRRAVHGLWGDVQYRSQGAIAAARAGAAASIIRSVTPNSQQTPHAGNMSYADDVRRIPHAAITVEHAELLHRMQDRGERIELLLKMNAQMLPDAPSRNVMAEITGSEFPNEVVVLGGHIDSWDVGQGDAGNHPAGHPPTP